MDATTTPLVTIPRSGLYFGLPAEEYHADPALGSTDLRRLAKNPYNYWYKSWMNPQRPPDKSTAAQTRGTAMHKLVYEGDEKFGALYMRGPDQDPDASPSEKAALTKAANKRAAEAGKTALPATDYDRIAEAAAMITKNPELSDVFRNGYPEVSFFWRRNGVPLKARFDYLKFRGIGDLKGVANEYEEDFETACRNAIARYRYDAQAAHYLDARALISDAIAEGLVFGDHDPEWARKLAETKVFGWVWIFHQTENAPITHAWKLSPANPMVACGRRVIDRGIERYRECMDKFGASGRWLMAEPVREIAIEEMPGFYARD